MINGDAKLATQIWWSVIHASTGFIGEPIWETMGKLKCSVDFILKRLSFKIQFSLCMYNILTADVTSNLF